MASDGVFTLAMVLSLRANEYPTRCRNRAFPARVGGRNRRRFANFDARFGDDTDELWSSN